MCGGRNGASDHHRTHLIRRSGIDEPANPKREIALKLAVLSRQMQKRFAQGVSDIAVTRSQWGVIVVVARNPGSSQRLIAEALDMTEAAAGRMIDRLCALGYLERKQRTDDRRAYSVWLTDKAGPILTLLGEIARKSEIAAFEGFSDAQLTEFLGYLNRVYANITPSRGGTAD